MYIYRCTVDIYTHIRNGEAAMCGVIKVRGFRRNGYVAGSKR